MSEKNWAELLGPGGPARKYFSDATGGALWVDDVCGAVSSQLHRRYVYFPLDDTRPLDAMIKEALADPRCKGFTLWKTVNGEYQVSVAIDTSTNFNVTITPDPLDALYTGFFKALERFKR